MSGYWNRDRAAGEPFRAWCEEHLPVERPAAWTKQNARGAENLREFVRETFGGAEHCADYRNGRAEEYGGREAFRAHVALMGRPVTPNGYAWTGGIGGSVGAPCEVCGRAC